MTQLVKIVQLCTDQQVGLLNAFMPIHLETMKMIVMLKESSKIAGKAIMCL